MKGCIYNYSDRQTRAARRSARVLLSVVDCTTTKQLHTPAKACWQIGCTTAPIVQENTRSNITTAAETMLCLQNNKNGLNSYPFERLTAFVYWSLWMKRAQSNANWCEMKHSTVLTQAFIWHAFSFRTLTRPSQLVLHQRYSAETAFKYSFD